MLPKAATGSSSLISLDRFKMVRGLNRVALLSVQKKSNMSLTFLVSFTSSAILFSSGFFQSDFCPEGCGVTKAINETSVNLEDGQLLHFYKTEATYVLRTQNKQHRRGIVMSCPIGQSQTHRGNWKPRRMVLGVEAVIKQLQLFKSEVPLFFGYYDNEPWSKPWCNNISETYVGSVDIICFKIPERYPKGLYGYAKIFAIKHAPIVELLWLDCDMYPVRPLTPLFNDAEFRKTGAMFWPDSRDYFEEEKIKPLLRSEESKQLFPVDAWYVKQGFDSGLVLLNRGLCGKQIEALCELARSPKMGRLRALSMGDKDMFHIVWMMHGRNFTLVPYIGESGSIQTQLLIVSSRHRERRKKLSPDKVGWKMSSQLKYGRDGKVYALHQLHKQFPYALVATLSPGKTFHTPEASRPTSYVKPFVIARQDLREIGSNGKTASTDFVDDVESVLIRKGKGILRPSTLDEAWTKGVKGFHVSRAPQWLVQAATDMSSIWHQVPRNSFKMVKPYLGKSRAMRNFGKGKFVAPGRKRRNAQSRTTFHVPKDA